MIARPLPPAAGTRQGSYGRSWPIGVASRIAAVVSRIATMAMGQRGLRRTNRVDTVYHLITAVDHTFAVRGAIVHNFGYAKRLRMAWYRYTEAGELICTFARP